MRVTVLTRSPSGCDVDLPALASALREATDFVTVGSIVCDFNRRCGIYQTAITLLDADRRPLIAVDDIPDMDDAYRIHYFRHNWRAFAEDFGLLNVNHLPIDDQDLGHFREMARRAGYTTPELLMHLLPLLEPAGLIGAMMVGRKEFPSELRSVLSVVAQHASIRLAQLGVRFQREPDASSRLTVRQLDVARLAAHGHTNAGIGDALGMSENTVKKHLKDVFERLDVATRAELATVMLQMAPREPVPIGVTHRGHLRITRAG